VKRYGGRVTGAPSSKTSYVVLGSDAGPKKIETIRKNNIPTINEDGLLQLIKTLPAHGGKGATGQQATAKKEAEEKKVMQMAKEMEVQEKQKAKVTSAKGGPAPDSQLWTEKYAPQALKDVVGNKSNTEKLQRWLHDWYFLSLTVLIPGL
jgi:replication factor C subunit 1